MGPAAACGNVAGSARPGLLPRIPLVSTAEQARAFADAGRALSDLHIGYETVEPYRLVGLEVGAAGDPYDFFAVSAKKMTFGKATAEQKAAGERYDRAGRFAE